MSQKEHICSDKCIKDFGLFDCDCYSHNPPESEYHELNPRARGMTHQQWLQSELDGLEAKDPTKAES